jgi:hypothetical protein
MLGFFLWGTFFAASTFVIWQLCEPRGSQWKLKAEHLLAACGAAAAVIGWMFTNLMSLRNSIRQHTITTLLQSRLSATYMHYADKLSSHYSDYEARKASDPALKESPTEKVDVNALRYILNYFEFIAIGIKRGDLDEGMLKDSLRSILAKNIEMSSEWLEKSRAQNDRYYANLLWLHGRWSK